MKRTPNGRLYYINRYTNTTQWHIPSQSVLPMLWGGLPLSRGEYCHCWPPPPHHRPGYEMVRAQQTMQTPSTEQLLNPAMPSIIATPSPSSRGPHPSTTQRVHPSAPCNGRESPQSHVLPEGYGQPHSAVHALPYPHHPSPAPFPSCVPSLPFPSPSLPSPSPAPPMSLLQSNG